MLNNFQKQILRNKLGLNPSKYFRKNLQAFSFSSAAAKLPTLEGKPADQKNTTGGNAVQPWVEVENRLAKLRGELVLADECRIEKYILGVIGGYFRTTYKDGLTMESKLSDHGLDSLDSIELGMILEDELGYIIEAETLPQFTKVKHFVNYIKQLEAYKKEHIVLPQVKAQEAEDSWDSWIPYGEKLKSKLFNMTVDKKAEKKDDKKH